MEGDSSHDPISDFLADISIHSLRMEGDSTRNYRNPGKAHFNPLPPHGGRHVPAALVAVSLAFQSTPSAWRETTAENCFFGRFLHFNPLPPHGGRQHCASLLPSLLLISIHSLRMEGDIHSLSIQQLVKYFNPLPPHGGRL